MRGSGIRNSHDRVRVGAETRAARETAFDCMQLQPLVAESVSQLLDESETDSIAPGVT